MKIEFIEFYPTVPMPEKGIIGTLRVRLPDHGIELLGAAVLKTQKGLSVFPPSKMGINPEGQKVRYPIFVFTDQKLHTDLIQALMLNGPAFVEKRIAEMGESIIRPTKKKEDPANTHSTQGTKSSQKPKEAEKLKESKPKAFQEYFTPPPPKRKAYCNSKR